MNRTALVLALAIAASGCGLKTDPTPAAPLWGDPGRPPVDEVFPAQSSVIEEDPSDLGAIRDRIFDGDEDEDDAFDDGDGGGEE